MHMHMHMHMYMCNMYSNSWHPLPPGFVLLMLLWFDPKCHCFARHDRQPSRGPSCPTVTCSAIVLTCDFAGNADECYWGLPSIQRGATLPSRLWATGAATSGARWHSSSTGHSR